MTKNTRDSGSKLTPLYAWLTIFSFLAALGVLGLQCFNWFQTGEWKPLSILTGLEQVEILENNESQFFQIREWLDQWNGLRPALEWFPLSGLFAIVGLLWLLLVATD